MPRTRRKAKRRAATIRRTASGKARPTRSTTRKPTPHKGNAAAVRVSELGRPVAIEYVADDGRTYRHDFNKRGARLYASEDGRAVIVSPVRVGRDGIRG